MGKAQNFLTAPRIILSHYIYFCCYVLIVLRFIFTYSTVTGRKCEINIIVIVIVMWQVTPHSCDGACLMKSYTLLF